MSEVTTTNVNSDVVDHPKHYNVHPSGVEAIEICEHLNFNLGNAFKYVYRHREKARPVEDLKKGLWYTRRELGRLALLEPAEIGRAPAPVCSWKTYLLRVDHVVTTEPLSNIAAILNAVGLAPWLRCAVENLTEAESRLISEVAKYPT